jgi:uncharacterized membrane protein
MNAMSFLETVSLLNVATTACIGLLVGSELFLTAFTNPVLRALDEPARLKAAHLLTARAATPLPLWNILGLVLLIAEAVVHRNLPGFSLLVAASVLWASAAAFTLTLMLPLNTRLARADAASSPKQSLLDYKRWSAPRRGRVQRARAAKRHSGRIARAGSRQRPALCARGKRRRCCHCALDTRFEPWER